MGPKKSRGFLDAARRLIAKHPGLTSKEIATRLLDSGEVTSYAHNPERLLTATLDGTTVAEDPGNNNQPSQLLGTTEVEITLRLPIWIIGLVDNQVNSGAVSSRGQAISRLVAKGLNASL